MGLRGDLCMPTCLSCLHASGGPSEMEEAKSGDGTSWRQNWTSPARRLHLPHTAASHDHSGQVQCGQGFPYKGGGLTNLVISVPICCPCRRGWCIAWAVGRKGICVLMCVCVWGHQILSLDFPWPLLEKLWFWAASRWILKDPNPCPSLTPLTFSSKHTDICGGEPF